MGVTPFSLPFIFYSRIQKKTKYVNKKNNEEYLRNKEYQLYLLFFGCKIL
jgi:hypothetical protein